MGKVLVAGFITGFIATIVFHQGTQFLMFHYGNGVPFLTGIFGVWPNHGFNLAPTAPLGVPAVISLAFWGGVFGIVLASVVRWGNVPDLLTGFLFGALVATLVAFTIVAQLKGQPMFAGGNHTIWWRAGLLNGAWGWGTAFLLRPMAMRG